MNPNAIEEISMTLIHQAEDECAERDPDMISEAAMVFVGDVYALLVCELDTPPHRNAPPAERESNDVLSPFIR